MKICSRLMITNHLHALEYICDYIYYIIELKPNVWHSMVQKYHSGNALEYRLKSQIVYLHFCIISLSFQYVFK